ncbi:MAG: ATP-binding protein [Desulfobacterales bacterium]|nr:ATP-binding protein [Desulfobacterales bacterium]
MIRRQITDELKAAAAEYPVVTITGPRQSGKTTLAQMTFPGRAYHSLEDPDQRLAAETDPRGFLDRLTEGAILDEIQRTPALLSYIQGIVDHNPRPGMFVVTGSHQPELQQNISQSLAGRTAILTLLPFSLAEIRHYRRRWDAFELIVTGTFPRVHKDRLTPNRFYNGYLQTYVERDVRALIHLKDLSAFQQFLTLLAGRIGQVINYNALSSDTGVSSPTIKSWISVLKASFVVFELRPYFANIRKRVIKSPKIYFTDPGLAAFLLGIETPVQAARDPLRGGLYENLVILELAKASLNLGRRPDLFFYRDTNGNEVDLVWRRGRRLVPIEIKSAATFTKSFLKGIERFRQASGSPCAPGYVLYNGPQEHRINDVHVINPLIHEASDLFP